MMLIKQYTGRQRAYEEAVKYLIGGFHKYGNAADWDTRNYRLLDRMTSFGWSPRKRQLNRKINHRVGTGNVMNLTFVVSVERFSYLKRIRNRPCNLFLAFH